MQSEREHENSMANAIYWIEHYCILQPTLLLDKIGIKFDVQNKWIVIAIVLVIIDIVLFILFYWIFKHIFLDLLKNCFSVIFALLVFLVNKVFRVNVLNSSEYDKVEKEELCNNNQLEKSDKVLILTR